mgnify:CR=1 FL=1
MYTQRGKTKRRQDTKKKTADPCTQEVTEKNNHDLIDELKLFYWQNRVIAKIREYQNGSENYDRDIWVTVINLGFISSLTGRIVIALYLYIIPTYNRIYKT